MTGLLWRGKQTRWKRAGWWSKEQIVAQQQLGPFCWLASDQQGNSGGNYCYSAGAATGKKQLPDESCCWLLHWASASSSSRDTTHRASLESDSLDTNSWRPSHSCQLLQLGNCTLTTKVFKSLCSLITLSLTVCMMINNFNDWLELIVCVCVFGYARAVFGKWMNLITLLISKSRAHWTAGVFSSQNDTKGGKILTFEWPRHCTADIKR